MKKTYLISALIAFAISFGTVGGFLLLKDQGQTIKIEHLSTTPSSKVMYSLNENGEYKPLDFTKTAEKVTDAVVFIKSTVNSPQGNNQLSQPFRQLPDPFKDFFGERFFFDSPDGQGQRNFRSPMPKVGSGSGVIINENGYIITNNHVIADADDIEVTLHDNRSFKATVVGTDPATDLALIQIKEKELPSLAFVNSDDVKIGEWVVAVGNPFSLTSTVTAGIVSAKARNININKDKFAVESFIQTDAAINPGNSGGALVNIDGGLVGINTAISSPTGSYSGYGFAVPSNIVSKVIEDLLKYGVVQRGVLGVMIRTIDGNFANEKGINLSQGVYVDSLLENSAAGSAGIKPGDVIQKVDGHTINTSPELQESIARHRPGDKISILVNREGNAKTFEVVLNNPNGNTKVTKIAHKEMISILGADFSEIDKDLAKKLEIDGGVQVTRLYAGQLRKQTQMREGFIITHVDGRKVDSIDELMKILEKKKGGIMLEGQYENLPGKQYYALGLN